MIALIMERNLKSTTAVQPLMSFSNYNAICPSIPKLMLVEG
jgi:hypothetical protein